MRVLLSPPQPIFASIEGIRRGVARRFVRWWSTEDWDDTFFVPAHATRNSLSFYADFAAKVAIQPRALAVRIFQNGYHGGDLVLLSCDSGLNRPLVHAVWSELKKLRLKRPVGVIRAPNRAINGGEIGDPNVRDIKWVEFRFDE